MWSMNEGFGELRSLMQLDVLDDSHRATLFALMRRGWEHDAKRYDTQWIDYMSGFTHHFLLPIAVLENIEDLEQAVVFAPHCRFGLDLSRRELGDDGATAIANSPYMASLTWLDLADNDIGDEGAQAIADSTHMAQLTHLQLMDNQMGPIGASAIANSPHMARLTYLALFGNHIGDEGTEAIAHSAHMARLTYLALGGNEIGTSGAIAIAESPHMTGLLRIGWVHNERSIGVQGVHALAQSVYVSPDVHYPTLSNMYHCLAIIQSQNGDLAGAKKLYEYGIALDEKVDEPDQGSLAYSYNTLAMVLQDLGDFPAAKFLFERAIVIDEKYHEPDDPYLATGYSKLAGVLQDIGDFPGAKLFFERAIAIDEKDYEHGHPWHNRSRYRLKYLGINYSKLAIILQNIGDLPGAKLLLERAISIQENDPPKCFWPRRRRAWFWDF